MSLIFSLERDIHVNTVLRHMTLSVAFNAIFSKAEV